MVTQQQSCQLTQASVRPLVVDAELVAFAWRLAGSTLVDVQAALLSVHDPTLLAGHT